ncbi:hypothetical protein BDV37DRAFT_290942 [Aspergillus pseudonomiae]|uniref:Uncharacterized protein n=1 Tax=Aspergillus pseudonomiae TaxID=1506151 RepID=A0A5N7CWJ0_9EURO|nr:uncharacterized protein BDV37DRAFT_290942 [Aspergillus pseudonomiae]KAE8398556.1 hypothetical protein BDV37DRAFT_290942 [Aspergillus pseudonomiae]
MKTKAKGKSKGKGKNKVKKDHTNNKDNTWLKHLRICTTASNETITEMNPGRVPKEFITQIEAALRIEDDTLDQPLLAKNEDTNAETTVKQVEPNTNSNEEPPRVGSLKRRLKMTFTGNPLKLSGGDSDRYNCQIHSQDKATRSEHSGSGAASLTDSNTTGTHGSIHSPTKKSPTTPPTPKFLKYVRSANDYIFLDLDFLETDTSNKVIQGGSLSAMEDMKQQAPGVSPPGKKSPETGGHDTKKGLQKQIAHIRSLTGTEVRTVSPTDSKSPRRVDDSRQWNTVNLRCTTCRGNCPICSVACCRYAEAQQTIADPETKPEKTNNARHMLQMIEGLANPEAAADVYVQTVVADAQLGYGRHTGKASYRSEYC